MDRRTWLVAVLGVPVALAHGQSIRPRVRLGVLLHGTLATYSRQISVLREALAGRGYVEPTTLDLIFRFSEGITDRLPALAGELVAMKVDIIVTSSTPAIRAAMTATQTIPIVFTAVADAVGSGLVASLARPGGNATGLTLLIPDLAAKQLELLGDLVPRLARITVLRARGEGAQAFESIAAVLTQRGVEARFVEVGSPDEIAPAFAAMQSARSQAVILVDGPVLNNRAAQLASLAASYRLPMISTLRLYVDAGSLASYGPSISAMVRRAATHYVDRILNGANPGDLPVEQPTRFEFVLNMKTANVLGIKISQLVLTRADEVIK